MSNLYPPTELLDMYQEYLKVIDDMPADATTQIPYREEVVRDKQSDAKKNLKPGTDVETYNKIMEKAAFANVPLRRHLLVENEMTGTAFQVFDRANNPNLSIYPRALVTLGELALLAEVIPKIPAERRNNAFIKTQEGYYWGGFFNRFEEETE